MTDIETRLRERAARAMTNVGTSPPAISTLRRRAGDASRRSRRAIAAGAVGVLVLGGAGVAVAETTGSGLPSVRDVFVGFHDNAKEKAGGTTHIPADHVRVASAELS